MIHILILLIACMVSASCFAESSAHEWAKRSTPTANPVPQSIGAYTSGCLSGALTLPTSGDGYQVMRLSRNRIYGHASLIQFIQDLGHSVANEKLGTLLVGDLGQPRGGPTLSGHRSHQSGLDVDIWFLISKQLDNRLLTPDERETWNAPSVVNMQTDQLDYRQWRVEHERVLEIAASQPEVDRIFVNASIKQALCDAKKSSSTAWLRKIRPWWKHDDHFHVRLKCPEQNPHCQGQPPLPAGDGCDSSLAWWFSREAKTPSKKVEPVLPPPLPALCAQVLNQ